jgi:hypothetical protein
MRESVIALRGTLPIQLRHELFKHPAGPVIRSTTTIYDDPQQPFLAETFINYADPSQCDDYAALATQKELHLLFVDGAHRLQLAKVVSNSARQRVPRVLVNARALLDQLPPDQVDFERAKRDILASITLDEP